MNIDHSVLSEFVSDLFQAVQVPASHAERIAELLVLSNLRGIDTHGVHRLKVYLKRLSTGMITAKGEMKRTEIPGTPMGILDGDNAMGFLVADEAVSYAVEKAGEYGVGLIWAKNSNHFGSAGLYSMKAAEKGMVGIVSTNVPPLMGMVNFKGSIVGNNPLAISVPMRDHPPFSVDISLSSVALGKLLRAMQEGSSIPDTWALDTQGRPTTDPKEGYAGFLLPMAMHKGFSLALALDLLTGVLAGGPFLRDISSMYKDPEKVSSITHLIIVIDPSRIMDMEDFYQRMSLWKDELHSIVSEETGETLHIPGEGLAATEAERRRTGVPLSSALLEELRELALTYGVDVPEWASPE